MRYFLTEAPPVSHPTETLIPGCGSALCQVSWDSLISSGVAIVLTIVIMSLIARRLSSGVPGKIQVWLESFYGYVRGQQLDIDEEATFIVPLALTVFFYILIANWVAFLPLPAPIHPANSDLNQTLAMGIVVFLIVQWYSLRVLGFGGYLRRFTKPFELPLPFRIFPFLLLNIIEEIAKPLTLALRLFGNIFGGLLMVWVLTNLLTQVPVPIAPYVISVVLVAAWKAFDVGMIGLIQAFIFAILTIIYFEQAREGLEHQPAAHASA